MMRMNADAENGEEEQQQGGGAAAAGDAGAH